MEAFTELFAVMDPWDFVEIMTAKMDYLFESIKADADLLALIGLLLEKKHVGLYFIDILGSYLVENKLQVLQDPECEVTNRICSATNLSTVFESFACVPSCFSHSLVTGMLKLWLGLLPASGSSVGAPAFQACLSHVGSP